MQDGLILKFLKFSYGSLVGLFLGLATTMITTRLLPPEAFGKVSMFDLTLQVGMIITIFGTDQSFVRFFYEEKSSKRGALLYNCMRLPMITTIIMLIFLIIFYKHITIFLIGEIDLKFAIWIGIGIIAQLLFRYAQLVIRMQQKGNLYSLLQIFERIFNLSFILLFFYVIGSRFEVLILSKVITLLLLVAIAIYFGREFWSLKNNKIKDVKHSQLEIVRFGSPFVLTIFISWLFESFDKIALRQWSNFEELGLYAAAMRLVILVMVLRQTFSTFWTPVAYQKFENNPEDRSFFRYICIIVSFLMFLVAIFSIAGKDILVMLLGEEYKVAATIVPFLVFMPVLYTISETTVVGINFYKKTKWHFVIAIIACIVNILGNWLLVPRFGAIGASVSTAFAYIVFFTLRTQISVRFFRVNYPLIRIYFMVFLVSIYALYSVFNEYIGLNIILGLLLIVILVVINYKDLLYIIKNRKEILN
ncbi:oligosaccharide flippase family protein [Virgibacillus sp. 6R]|uniref:lipopolysaccharide biosynthesis protein n=1 Tax=Metabacillus sp. 22489 TaxID=3453928 RepID=UPI0011A2AC65